jgi:hypothetical protein
MAANKCLMRDAKQQLRLSSLACRHAAQGGQSNRACYGRCGSDAAPVLRGFSSTSQGGDLHGFCIRTLQNVMFNDYASEQT